MSTATWNGVEQIMRNRFLTYVPPNAGATLATRLGSTATGSGSDGKLFLDMAPDDLTGLWAVLRALDTPVTGFDGGNLIRALYELTFYGQQRRLAAQVKACAVVAHQAWKGFSYTEVGGVLIADKMQNGFMVPTPEPPMDRELVQYRLLVPFRVAPIFLLQVTNA